jgi:transcriptional regulator with XRE-family HTH domain
MAIASYAAEVRRVREAGLETADIATATGVDPTTVSAWLHARRNPTGERRLRLIELSAIVERLASTMDPAYVPIWLLKPVAALANRRPIEVIAKGGYQKVLQIVDQLESDSFA